MKFYMSVGVKSKDIKKAHTDGKKGNTTAQCQPAISNHSSRPAAKVKLNLLCCPVIFIHHEAGNDGALIPSAPPPPYDAL